MHSSSRHPADMHYARPLAFSSVANVARDMTSVRGVFAKGTAPYAAYQSAARSFFASMMRITPPTSTAGREAIEAQDRRVVGMVNREEGFRAAGVVTVAGVLLQELVHYSIPAVKRLAVEMLRDRLLVPDQDARFAFDTRRAPS